MEIIITYVIVGLLFAYGVSIAIDISQSRRYDKRERELVKTVLKGL
jgi:signal transduction histidine kinase